MNLTISSDNVAGIDILFGIYKALPGNEGSELNSFYRFLFQDTAERAAFLEKYCDYTYIRYRSTMILKVNPKSQE